MSALLGPCIVQLLKYAVIEGQEKRGMLQTPAI